MILCQCLVRVSRTGRTASTANHVDSSMSERRPAESMCLDQAELFLANSREEKEGGGKTFWVEKTLLLPVLSA